MSAKSFPRIQHAGSCSIVSASHDKFLENYTKYGNDKADLAHRGFERADFRP